MVPNAPETDGTAQLEDEEIPFEAPPGRTGFARDTRTRGVRGRKPKTSNTVTGLLAITYAIGAAGIGAIDQGFLLLAWLVTGPLIFVGYRALKRGKP